MAKVTVSYRVYGSVEVDIPDEILQNRQELQYFLDDWQEDFSPKEIAQNLSLDGDDFDITIVSDNTKTYLEDVLA